MKTKLLQRLRRRGRNMISIYSVETTTTAFRKYISGVKYGYYSDEYAGLGDLFDPEKMKEAAARIYITSNIDSIRQRYRRYSRKYKSTSNK